MIPNPYARAPRPIAECPKNRRKYCRTAAQTARDHGVSRQAIVQWQALKCPSYIAEDGSRLFESSEMFNWRVFRETGRTKEEILAEDARRAALLKSGHCPNCAAKLAAR